MGIRLTSFSGNKSESKIYEVNESAQEKSKRIVKTCMLLLAIFVVSLFIPIVHFIVPPMCLVIGISFIVKSARYKQIKILGTGTCPECKNDFPITELTIKFPIKTFCPHCRNQIYIEKF